MRAITDREQITQAYAHFAGVISEGGTALERMVGFKGASEMAQLLWHSELQLWVLLQPDRIDTRYWCAFGIDDPHPAGMLSITCEINPPKEGIDRRCAGLFVRNQSGVVFLAHSGKVGGGRAGIGKTAFLDHWGQDDIVSVLFPDGEENDYIILGRLDGSDFRERLARFVHCVGRFKEGAVGEA
jgi:hypothetical protein